MPSLILQPMVENSIKYAVTSRVDGGTIQINARKFASELLLEIIDDGPGIELNNDKRPMSGGVGIANTLDRLKELLEKNTLAASYLPATRVKN